MKKLITIIIFIFFTNFVFGQIFAVPVGPTYRLHPITGPWEFRGADGSTFFNDTIGSYYFGAANVKDLSVIDTGTSIFIDRLGGNSRIFCKDGLNTSAFNHGGGNTSIIASSPSNTGYYYFSSSGLNIDAFIGNINFSGITYTTRSASLTIASTNSLTVLPKYGNDSLYLPLHNTITINGSTKKLLSNPTFTISPGTTYTVTSPLSITSGSVIGISNAPNSILQNSTISGVALGSSLFAHTVGYGLSGSSYNGSSAIAWKADSTVLASKLFTAATYQTKLTNPITGTGTTGQLAVWNGTNSQTGYAELFYSSSTQMFGFGTNTPSNQVDIAGNYNGTTSSSGGLLISNNNSAGYVNLELINDASDIGQMILTGSAGAIGGTNIASRQLNFISLGTNGINFLAANASGFIAFNAGGAANERMRILANGNVCIGATTGSYPLSVSGDIGVATAGNTIRIKTGTNGMIGTGVLTAGVYTVTISGLTSSDIAQGNYTATSGTGLGVLRYTCSANTLTVTSLVPTSLATQILDSSTVSYTIFRPY